MKLEGDSEAVDTDELRVGGESEGVLDGARDEGVAYARCLWGPMAYDVKVAGVS